MFCEFGERLSERFNIINDEILDWDVYIYPKNIQKILPIILYGTQKSVALSGFGNIQCTRDTFKKVRHFLVTEILVGIGHFNDWIHLIAGVQRSFFILYHALPSLNA